MVGVCIRVIAMPLEFRIFTFFKFQLLTFSARSIAEAIYEYSERHITKYCNVNRDSYAPPGKTLSDEL